MSYTYLTAQQLAEKIQYDARTIRNQLKDSVKLLSIQLTSHHSQHIQKRVKAMFYRLLQNIFNAKNIYSRRVVFFRIHLAWTISWKDFMWTTLNIKIKVLWS